MGGLDKNPRRLGLYLPKEMAPSGSLSATAENIFFKFSPKIACQAPKPPNSLKQKKIEFEI
jgi:hypothetical protein